MELCGPAATQIIKHVTQRQTGNPAQHSKQHECSPIMRADSHIGCSRVAMAPAACACSLAMYSGRVATGAKVSCAAAQSSVHSASVFVVMIAAQEIRVPAEVC